MYQKILWKIEELWQRDKEAISKTSYNVMENYDEQGISRYYSRFHWVNEFNFTSSKYPVFEDDYGKYYGLEKCQVTKINGKLVYVFDNHNEIIFPLVEVFEKNKNSFSIIHIDAHPDDALFVGEKLNDISLEKTKEYITKTRISDFFDALSEYKRIKDIIRVCHSDTFNTFVVPQEPYILSLDIDIFGPEGNFVSLEDKIQVIRQAWNRAEVVCIATSPGFIDQDFAGEIIKILCCIQDNE